MAARNETSQNGLQAAKQTPSPVLNDTDNNKEVTPRRVNQGDRDLCVYQFFEDGSCPFNRCMFNHTISQDQRDCKETKERMAVKQQRIQSKNRKKEPRTQNNNNICENAYFGGPNSCTLEGCRSEHNLDYRRIDRGICHFYVLRRCNRPNECRFSHQIPVSVLNDPETKRTAEEFRQQIRTRWNNTNQSPPHQQRTQKTRTEQTYNSAGHAGPNSKSMVEKPPVNNNNYSWNRNLQGSSTEPTEETNNSDGSRTNKDTAAQQTENIQTVHPNKIATSYPSNVRHDIGSQQQKQYPSVTSRPQHITHASNVTCPHTDFQNMDKYQQLEQQRNVTYQQHFPQQNNITYTHSGQPNKATYFQQSPQQGKVTYPHSEQQNNAAYQQQFPQQNNTSYSYPEQQDKTTYLQQFPPQSKVTYPHAEQLSEATYTPGSEQQKYTMYPQNPQTLTHNPFLFHVKQSLQNQMLPMALTT